ncbi:GTPase-activating protein gyp8 [Purpureocillium takamizusanense]|uniref:GTPase-activating protein gyp8 n=1 Tax=Purpureocillium takamizusanense TaxID=2060973 RepID=A0A9Q8QNS4_9HYPO|nr:GTPase-activating protein gyp8 [Purpureocillium takamizusanense]UNI22064.1 GTPase-activating protein gyp8 [Purpureocillium takamizusanense]
MAPGSEAIEAVEALVRRGSPEGAHLADPTTCAGDDDDDNPRMSQKGSDILDACKWRDVPRLRALAESEGGFLNDGFRRAAWPILLGLPPLEAAATSPGDVGDWQDLPRHRDEDQVELDVNRSFVYYPNGQSEAQLEQCKSELSSLIVEVLRRHPYLCYFQGYHDICQVFMLVLEPPWRAKVVARLSILRIRDFMLPSLGPTTSQLRLLPDLLGKADPKLRQHVATIEPFYALAGTLTMYAHNIEAYHEIARLFDVFLAREPVFTIYVFAQIVMDRRDEILEIDEPDMLQVVLAKVPRNMDLDVLIANSVRLFDRYPPESLRPWKSISGASVLKTARDVGVCARQTLEDGHAYFQQQVKDIRWADMQDRIKMAVWRYRRPARAFGIAIAVAALAFYLRRSPTLVHYMMSFFSK